MRKTAMSKGKVYLVGAGPGDPELISVKGRRLLEEADVVIYDRLVAQGVLAYIKPDSEKIFVGKMNSFHTIPQDDINRLLVEKAREGNKVVRLKGGDPYIFGRGAEEAAFLSERGIEFEVVPGITAASGVAAYSGIPLTFREYASAVTFITGHRRETEDPADINWAALAGDDHTLVFYMGVKNLDIIATKLIAHGRDPDTPAAVVRSGTTPEQKTVSGALSEISRLAESASITPPALLIVGEVINMRDSLCWFKN